MTDVDLNTCSLEEVLRQVRCGFAEIKQLSQRVEILKSSLQEEADALEEMVETLERVTGQPVSREELTGGLSAEKAEEATRWFGKVQANYGKALRVHCEVMTGELKAVRENALCLKTRLARARQAAGSQ